MISAKIRANDAAALADVLFSFMPQLAAQITERLDSLDLTSTDYWALRNLQSPMPMKELALCMDFDPSYVTVLADRLETRGLVTREQDESDRRIKNLVLTPKGRRLKKTLPETLWSGSSVFSTLTDAERTQLHQLVTKMLPPSE